MMLQKRYTFSRPPQFNPPQVANTVAPQLGQVGLSWPIPRDKPVEELIVRATFQVVNGAALTLLANGSQAALDNILGVCRKFRVNRPTGSQRPASTKVVDYRGIGLLEYCANTGLNLDAATLNAVALSQGATIANGTWVRIVYRIPLVHPLIGEPLRERMCLPCHTWTESATLEIDFEQASNIYTNATAGVIGNLNIEVGVLRRDPVKALTDATLAAGGYIPCDLIESNFAIGVGIATEQRLPLAQAGKQLNVQFCHYLGGASITRNVPDAVTTPGSESVISYQENSNEKCKFIWSQLQTLNDYSRVRNSASQTYSPAIGLPVAANTQYPVPASVMYDALSDSIGTDNQSATEFGSVIDLDALKAAGALAEFVFTPANVATNGSTIYYGGHRVYGNLAGYAQLLAA
ncbi:MAG TPA: hypothetical protein VFC07_00985 [Verrucomicrobiae bacterium]|nr:hypothetical protein [Verrucomicrobiae bacterium]